MRGLIQGEEAASFVSTAKNRKSCGNACVIRRQANERNFYGTRM
jgi:hypothetical protein